MLQDFLQTHHSDLFAITETWLTTDTPQATLNSLTPPGYLLLHKPRIGGIGGGVGLLYKSHLRVTSVPIPTSPAFECLCVRLSLPSTSLTVLVVYRPPSLSKPNFCADFSTLLETLTPLPSELLITGDFNFHVDPPVPQSDVPFLDLLDTFALKQHIPFPHTLSTFSSLASLLSSSRLSRPWTWVSLISWQSRPFFLSRFKPGPLVSPRLFETIAPSTLPPFVMTSRHLLCTPPLQTRLTATSISSTQHCPPFSINMPLSRLLHATTAFTSRS